MAEIFDLDFYRGIRNGVDCQVILYSPIPGITGTEIRVVSVENESYYGGDEPSSGRVSFKEDARDFFDSLDRDVGGAGYSW